MGTKSLSRLKTHLDFINTPFVNDFVYGNMWRAFGSLQVFICNYVLLSFGFVLRYIFRFLHLGDAKDELIVPLASQADVSEIDGFQELAEFLFWSEDYHEGSEKRKVETECSVSMENHSDIHEDTIQKKVHCESSDIFEDAIDRGTEEDDFFSMESDSDNSVIHEDGKEHGGEAKGLVNLETEFFDYEDGKKAIEDETTSFVSIIDYSDLHQNSITRLEEEEETSEHVFVEDLHEDVNEIDENKAERSTIMESLCSVNEDDKTEYSVSKDDGFNANGDSKRIGEKVEENETTEPVFMEYIHEVANKIDENKTEHSVPIEDASAVNEENEAESSVSRNYGSNVHGERKNKEENEEETDGPVFVETDSVATTCKCQYLSGKDICGFVEQPTTLSFSFREFYMGPDVSSVSDNARENTRIIADKEFSELDLENDSEAHEETEYSVMETEDSVSNSIPSFPFRFESEVFGETDSSDEDCYVFNENSLTSDSESESSSSSGLIWGNSNKLDDSIDYQFLGGARNGGEGFESEILKLMMREERTEYVEEKKPPCDRKVSDFRVHGIYCEDGYLEIEPGMKNFKSLDVHGFGGIDSAKPMVKDQKEGSHYEGTKWEDELSESESDDDDFEWEHDDLVEQLKMELRNSRQGGLATILEEEEEEEEHEEEVTESPKVVQDLKPLKIEDKVEFKDQIDEIQKVYKSYAEKMRKLDILNYQTMHALGLLQLKDPLKSISIPKSTTPGAVISQNLWPRKSSKNKSDPLLKFVHELHRELELVYVGQICLSWEILCWQHKKALELQQYDSEESHRYNLVAGEFQLFQVLVQRFIESEPFQGPRIQNYVKNRCVIRNLLQVPAVKDDSQICSSKGNEEENAIASGKLAEIIKESMRVFWEFVRADKDYGNVILKVSQQVGTDLKDPAISGLLLDIRTQLQKKEKRLKDIVRTGNCIVRKFQKHHEDELDHEQLVAQVGLRLISRVMSMSKLRKEQIIWCNEKLQRIKFLSRKIVHVEPSFLLFPC